MARSLTSQTVSAAMAARTSEILLWIMTIEHADLATPLRVVDNGEDISSGGDLYTATHFEILPADDKDGLAGQARVRFGNVDQWLTGVIRDFQDSITITPKLVVASDLGADPPEFDVVEVSFLPMYLREIRYNATEVEATLTYEQFTGADFPAHSFTPRDNAGVF